MSGLSIPDGRIYGIGSVRKITRLREPLGPLWVAEEPKKAAEAAPLIATKQIKTMLPASGIPFAFSPHLDVNFPD